ncbi:hypothetical protein HYT00_00900 [Candidatus Giovannonibacteria bacterium]|nr:hypothetical protein [Candidatus Giovannonibacteria bacterium]
MSEVIKIEDFNKEDGDRDEAPKKKESNSEVIDFERSVDLINVKRKFADFETRYKKLKFLSLKKGGGEELERLSGDLVGEIEDFESDLDDLEQDAVKESNNLNKLFREASEKVGFDEADKEYGNQLLREDERLIKLVNLVQKSAELKNKIIELL